MRIVFINGAGCTADTWNEQREMFPDALAYTLPGHERAGEPDTIAAFASLLLDELEQNESYILCGHSMGGAIALDATLRRDPRIRALVMLCSGAKLRVGPAILELVERDFEAALRDIPQYCFADPAPERAQWLTGMMRRVGQAQVLRDYRACDAFDALDRLGEVGVPLLALGGERDRMTPPKFALALADRVTGAQARILEGAGHFAMVERPAETNAALRAFVDQIRS